jgi:hypothetical protein
LRGFGVGGGEFLLGIRVLHGSEHLRHVVAIELGEAAEGVDAALEQALGRGIFRFARMSAAILGMPRA